MTSSIIARWLKSVLGAAGIDTFIFNAYSVRGTSLSKVGNMGITTYEILKAANWSLESVFQRFYHKLTEEPKYGRVVLTKVLENERLSYKKTHVNTYARLRLLKYNSRMDQTTQCL